MSTDKTPNFQGHTTNFKTSRRGLFAAAAVFAAMVTTRTKAQAFARPPGGGGGGANCVLRGTHVLTPNGEITVEDLAIGDHISTVDGTAKPIKWIGRSSSDRISTEILPIKISHSALGHLVPHADLYVSPLHALYIDGILVPARNLVNGRSIVHCNPADFDTVDYFHIELDGHDVMFTEGAPTETLLADRNREFDNWTKGDELSGDLRPVQYAPRLPANGSAVIRSRLRSAVSPLIDIRQPGDCVWERIAERAETQIAA